MTRPRAILILCAVAYFCLAVLFSRSHGFWSPDSAVRLVQVEAVLRSGAHDPVVTYPAQTLDPEGRYFPSSPRFHFQRDGKHYITYLPYFSIVSAPLFRMLGFAGLTVLPVAAGLVTLWITWRVLQARVPSLAPAGVVALAMGTPLLLYSTTFWDHSPAVAAGAGALALAAQTLDAEGEGVRLRLLGAAGLLLGLGLWLRNEMYLLALATIGMWALATPARRARELLALGAGVAAAGAPLWAMNTRFFGTPLGWKGQDLVAGRAAGVVEAVSGNGFAGWVTYKLGNAYYQLISPDFYAFDRLAVLGGVVLAGALVGSALMLRRGAALRSRPLIVTGTLIAVAVIAILISRHAVVSGLLAAAPFTVLALLSLPVSRSERFLAGVVVAFSSAVILTSTHGGIQWGPRYLMPIVPALVWLAAGAIERARHQSAQFWPPLRSAAAMLVGMSILLQTAGVDQLLELAQNNARVKATIRAAPTEVVVIPFEWMAVEAGEVFFEKRLLLVRDVSELQAVVARLSEHRVPRWTYIPWSGKSFTPKGIETWSEGRGWQFLLADDLMHEGFRLVIYRGSPSARPPTPACPSCPRS